MSTIIEKQATGKAGLSDQGVLRQRLERMVGRTIEIRPRKQAHVDVYGRSKIGSPVSKLHKHHYVVPVDKVRRLKVHSVGMHEGRAYAWATVEVDGDQGFRSGTYYLLWGDDFSIFAPT